MSGALESRDSAGDALPRVVDTAALAELQRRIQAALASGADLTEVLLDDAPRRLQRAASLPRRFTAELCEQELAPAAGLDTAAGQQAFAALKDARLIEPVNGRDAWWQVNAARRDAAAARDSGEWAAVGGPAWRALHHRLALYFHALGADGEWEELYHRLCLGEAAGERAWIAAYEAAGERFDLARCETLLRLLDECARYVSPALAARGTEERGLLAARAAFAEDHARTSRYLERAPLIVALEALLTDRQRFILQLHAPGGSGKTMFLRWLGPRWCLPRGIAIARVDFDFLDASERALATAFMLGKLAERLDPQLRGAPLFELLRDVAEERRRALADPARCGEAEQARLEQEVRERLARVLVEHAARKPLLLVFDTMEDAALKHQVNVMALVRAIDALRQRLIDLAGDDAAPRLLLILAGRYTLAEQYPAVHEAFAQRMEVLRIAPFDEDESRRYLRRRLLGIASEPSAEAIAAVLERARGNPFKLSLYADILMGSPHITPDELGQGVDVDMLYLVERVLRRIPDAALRWLLRYGVLARRLTPAFVEQVLLPPLKRALAGDRRDDDPARDGVAHRDWPGLWSPGGTADAAALWRRLREYASGSSWINVDSDGADALVIQPIVSHPMRRALLRQERPVVGRIHRAAIALARARPDDAQALADLTYHDFQLRGAKASAAWWRRVEQARLEPPALRRALAAVILSEDLRESERDEIKEAPLVDVRTRARALHTIAASLGEQAREAVDEAARDEALGQARSYLREYDSVAASLKPPAVAAADDGELRLELLGHDPAQRERAIAALVGAVQGRLDGERRSALLLTLMRAQRDEDAQQSRAFAQQWGRLALRRGDAAGYGEHLLDEVRALIAARRAAAAWALIARGRAQLAESGRWTSRAETREARAWLLAEEPEALAAAGLHEAAAERLDALIATPDVYARAPLQRAEIELGRGHPQAAAEICERFLRAKRSGGTDQNQAVTRRRIRALLMLAQASRVRLDFKALLDTLSQALSLQSAIGDHFNEVLTRLHLARVWLFDIGNLNIAAEQMQDSDDALAHESAELRIEHHLLRGALAALRGQDDRAQSLIGQAWDLLDGLPAGRWRVRMHVALAGLHWGPAQKHARDAQALIEAWSRLDTAGARLAASHELRYLPRVEGLTPAQYDELDRLTRVEPLRGGAAARLRAGDRIRLTMQRAELLRVIGRGDTACAELRALRALMARQAPAAWWRTLARCCDRLGVDPETVLPANWLVALTRHLRGSPVLAGVVQLEAAERAQRAESAPKARAAALKQAARAAERAQVLIEPSSPRNRWQLRLALLRERLAQEMRPPPAPAARRALAAQIDEARQQLGWPQTATTPEPAPAASPAGPVSNHQPSVPTAVTSVQIHQPQHLSTTAHLLDGRREQRVQHALTGHFALLLDALGAGRLYDGAVHDLLSQFGQRGLAVGRWFADAALPPVLAKVLADPLTTLMPREVAVEHRQAAMHAMPWELLIAPDQADRGAAGPVHCLSTHPALRRLWRAPPHYNLNQRVAWVQRALTQLKQGSLAADGLCGPETVRVLQRWQQHSGRVPTGWPDEDTLVGLAGELRALAPQPSPTPPSVLLIAPSRDVSLVAQRGPNVGGTDIEWLYRSAGVAVETLEVPDIEALQRLTAGPHHRVDVVHIAAPIAQSRSSGELSLQFAARHGDSHTTPFSASVLGRLLYGTALVLVEAPRSTSRDETVRQLLLRNSFAAQMFEHGELPAVLAMGLAQPQAQQRLTRTLAEAIAARAPLHELVARLRAADPNGLASEDMLDRLATAGIALFSRDPMITRDPRDAA